MRAEDVTIDVVRDVLLRQIKARWSAKRKRWLYTVVHTADADTVVRWLNLSMHSEPTRTHQGHAGAARARV
jgi:hypothetical protein